MHITAHIVVQGGRARRGWGDKHGRLEDPFGHRLQRRRARARRVVRRGGGGGGAPVRIMGETARGEELLTLTAEIFTTLRAEWAAQLGDGAWRRSRTISSGSGVIAPGPCWAGG
jgi:hypothetical protein